MATTRSFQDMLNEFLPNKLLKEELLKRDYLLTTCQKDDSWKGGKLIVPFKAAGASSIRMGKLTAAGDISQDDYVRGSVDDYVEAWGSMIFNHRDLLDHDTGKVKEDTFLRILPDTVEDFMEYMKMIVSVQLGTGPSFAAATVDGTAAGVVVVNRIDRFVLGQKVTLKGTVAAAADFYVISIDLNTNKVTLSATRGGAAADVSAYTTADAAKFYTDDADLTSFQSMRDALLSAANGGSATLHSQTKLDYPFLQAVNIDGSGWTAETILKDLFDGYNEVRKKARGRANKILMSYDVGAAVMAAVESGNTGNYQVSVKKRKASIYGWDEITLNTVKGELTIVMIQEFDDDVCVYYDPSSMTFYSNGFFRKRKGPGGNEYFEVRSEDGYQYIVDVSLYGEAVYNRPGNNGIAFGISL
jgi:hypothetical protein